MKKVLIFFVFALLISGNLKSQKLIKDFGNNHVSTSAISFTSDGRFMVVGGYVKSYDVSIASEDFRTIQKDMETQADFSFTVSVNTDDRTFLLTKFNRIEIWDLQSRTLMKSIRDSKIAVTAACFSADGRYIIYMRKNGEIVFINSSGFTESHKQKITGETPTTMTPSPDGKKLFIGTKSNSIIVFDVNTRLVSSFKVTGTEIRHIEFSGTGNYIAVSTADGRIWLGRYPFLDQIKSWQAHVNGYTAISFHPSGKYLASGGKDKFVRIWSIPECSRISEWQAHKLAVLSIAFSPDGVTLASGSQNDLLARGDDTKIWSFVEGSKVISASKENIKVPSNTDGSSPPVQITPSSQKRLALVIGNGNYLGSSLANPENDAREMKNILLQYGFDVLEHENLNQSQMKKAMDEFGDKLKNYNVGLFFYAGHGIQSKGYNYLVPVDANIKSEEQVEYDCVQADRILAFMESSGTSVNIIILDACRNNPFERSWTRSASGMGLAFMNAPKGSLIAYATAPGSTASDGSGKNGLYTSALLESIRIPNINILQVFQNVRNIVTEKSAGKQTPWESTSLTGDFYF